MLVLGGDDLFKREAQANRECDRQIDHYTDRDRNDGHAADIAIRIEDLAPLLVILVKPLNARIGRATEKRPDGAVTRDVNQIGEVDEPNSEHRQKDTFAPRLIGLRTKVPKVRATRISLITPSRAPWTETLPP